MLRQIKKTVLSMVIVLAVSVCMILLSLFAVKFSTVFYILICGVIGLAIYFLRKLGARKEEPK